MQSLTRQISAIAKDNNLVYGRIYKNNLVASTKYKIWGIRSGYVQQCARQLRKKLNVKVTITTRKTWFGTTHDIIVTQ